MINNLWKESLHAKSMDCERPKVEDLKVDPSDKAEPVLKDEINARYIIIFIFIRPCISVGLSVAND